MFFYEFLQRVSKSLNLVRDAAQILMIKTSADFGDQTKVVINNFEICIIGENDRKYVMSFFEHVAEVNKEQRKEVDFFKKQLTDFKVRDVATPSGLTASEKKILTSMVDEIEKILNSSEIMMGKLQGKVFNDHYVYEVFMAKVSQMKQQGLKDDSDDFCEIINYVFEALYLELLEHIAFN